MNPIEFRNEQVHIGGGDHVSALVGYEDGTPQTVRMGYDAFCELVVTLWMATEAVDPAAIPEVAPAQIDELTRSRESRTLTPREPGQPSGAEVINIGWARRARQCA